MMEISVFQQLCCCWMYPHKTFLTPPEGILSQRKLSPLTWPGFLAFPTSHPLLLLPVLICSDRVKFELIAEIPTEFMAKMVMVWVGSIHGKDQVVPWSTNSSQEGFPGVWCFMMYLLTLHSEWFFSRGCSNSLMGINSWTLSPLPDSRSQDSLGSSSCRETGPNNDILAVVFLAKDWSPLKGLISLSESWFLFLLFPAKGREEQGKPNSQIPTAIPSFTHFSGFKPQSST